MRWSGRNRQPVDPAVLNEQLEAAADAMFASPTDLTLLSSTIKTLVAGIPRVAADDYFRWWFLASLGEACNFRADLTHDVADRKSAVRYGEQALTSIPTGIPQYGVLLERLAEHYIQLFEVTRDPADLDAVIRHSEQAHAEAAVSPTSLARLAYAYQVRFAAGGSPADLDAQIRTAERGVADAVAEGDDLYRSALHQLAAGGYEVRYDSTHQLDALDAAISWREAEEAANLIVDSAQAKNLSNLSQDYLQRHQRTRDPVDLTRALEKAGQAVDLAGPRDPDHAELLYKMSMVHRARFKLAGDPDDLPVYIDLAERSRRLAPARYEAAALVNLGVAYVERYDHLGDPADLDRGIETSEEVLAHAGLTSDQRVGCLANLAGMYRRRHQRFGAQTDLDHALQFSDRAVRAAPQGDPELAHVFGSLAVSHAERYERGQDKADLDAAVEFSERALASAAADPLQRRRLQAQLADYLAQRFLSEADTADLDAGAELAELAVAATDQNDPEWPDFAAALGQVLLLRHRLRAGGPQDRLDIDRLIVLSERTLAVARPDSRLFLGTLSNLAVAYQEPAAEPDRRADVVRRLTAGLATATDSTPTELARTMTNIAHVAQLAGLQTEAAALWRSAVELLPLCVSRRMPWNDQEYQLSGSRGLLGNAIAAQLALGDLATAVELAEFGRGVLLSNQLSTPTEPTPPRLADLQQAASDGAVVLVNVGMAGGDAVILRSDSVRRVALPKLTTEKARTHANALAGVQYFAEGPLPKARAAEAKGATRELLGWLWETITEPVLTALGYDQPPAAGQPLPRVWWVGTGELGLLPLHAAEAADGRSALDLAVSSYSPTIRALVRGRQRAGAPSYGRLTVTMQQTEGLPDLPATAQESTLLQARYPGTITLAGEAATIEAVLGALPAADWVHFSCHATNDPSKASRSGLHLHDGALTIPAITTTQLGGGELAYLSACSTGQGNLFLADEAIHLASAFQIAGYRHVVATLWPVNDQVAALAARQFYRLLGDAPTADGAALALHELTRRLRSRFPDAPHLWAPFVHSGP